MANSSFSAFEQRVVAPLARGAQVTLPGLGIEFRLGQGVEHGLDVLGRLAGQLTRQRARAIRPPVQRELAAPVRPLEIAVGAVLVELRLHAVGVLAQRLRVVVRANSIRFVSNNGPASSATRSSILSTVATIVARRPRRDRTGLQRCRGLRMRRLHRHPGQRRPLAHRSRQLHPPRRIPRTDGQRMPQQIDGVLRPQLEGHLTRLELRDHRQPDQSPRA